MDMQEDILQNETGKNTWTAFGNRFSRVREKQNIFLEVKDIINYGNMEREMVKSQGKLRRKNFNI